MPRKATHYGICQVCNCRQKLPGGLMAKHGYTTRYSFFEGTCYGSDNLPYEQSCDLVIESIKRAYQRSDELCARAEELRNSNYEGETHAYVDHYFSSNHRNISSGYHRVHVPITATVKSNGDYTWTEFSYEVEVPKWYRGAGTTEKHRLEFYGKRYKTVPEVILDLNTQYAKSLDVTATRARDYAVEQQQRVDAWKPQDLMPVAA